MAGVPSLPGAPGGDVMPSQLPAAEIEAKELPLRPDGKLDVAQLDLNDRDSRMAFVADLADLCRAYGAAETVQTLIPMMQVACQFDDAATQIAQALAEISHIIDHSCDPFVTLLPLFHDLWFNVDGRIGGTAAKVAVDLVERQATNIQTVDKFIDTVATLASGNEGVSAKCASAALLPAAYRLALTMPPPSTGESGAPKSSSSSSAAARPTSSSGSGAKADPQVVKAQLRRAARMRALYSDLAKDSSTAVRRAAAASLALWLSLKPSGELLYDLQAWSAELIRDRLQDSVRCAALPHLVGLANAGDEAAVQSAQKLFAAAAKDVSWRVRWTAARHIVTVLTAHPRACRPLLAAVRQLAGDEEIEVRSCIAERLGDVVSVLSPAEVSAEIVPLVVEFVDEAQQTRVRAAVAASVCDVCRAASDDHAKKLLDVVAQLIVDEADTVQFNILRGLPSLKDRLNDTGFMNRITALLLRVSQVFISRWRVRERVAEQLRHLAPYVRTDNTAAFETMVHTLVRDPVSAVRRTAMLSLPQVAARFGPKWSRIHIGKFAADLRHAEGFRERQLYVQVLEAMLPFAVVHQHVPQAAPTPQQQQLSSSSAGFSQQGSGEPGNGSFASPMRSEDGVSPGRSPSRPAPDSNSASDANGATDPLDAPTGAFENTSQSQQHIFAPGRGATVIATSTTTELSPFWKGIADDLRTLSRDNVSNVRLALCHWLGRPSAAHIPQLAPAFAALRGDLASDTDTEVRNAAVRQDDSAEATPY